MRIHHSAAGKDHRWAFGDQGFSIRLSSYVPNVIAANVGTMVDRVLDAGAWDRGEIGNWAIHPGGKAILDRVAEALALSPDRLEDSRAVLRRHGNMSSASILFVLKRLLDRPAADHEPGICAMAFGPGLTLESAVLERVSGPVLDSMTSAAGRATYAR